MTIFNPTSQKVLADYCRWKDYQVPAPEDVASILSCAAVFLKIKHPAGAFGSRHLRSLRTKGFNMTDAEEQILECQFNAVLFQHEKRIGKDSE